MNSALQRPPIFCLPIRNGVDLVGHVVELADGRFEAVDIRGQSRGRFNTCPPAVRALTHEPGNVD